jgi:hypothetical protein
LWVLRISLTEEKLPFDCCPSKRSKQNPQLERERVVKLEVVEKTHTYIWVMMSEDPSAARLQVTPCHASQTVGAHGSPFHPILSGILRDCFNACMAKAAFNKSQHMPSQPSTKQLLNHIINTAVPNVVGFDVVGFDLEATEMGHFLETPSKPETRKYLP